MQSYNTRRALELAQSPNEVIDEAEAVVRAHYERIRDLYDEPTLGETEVLAKMEGLA